MQDLINALALGSVYLLFALGLSISWSTLGILNFAHGAIFMFSAFVCYLIAGSIPLGLPALLIVGVAVGAALSLLVQFAVFGPILRRSSSYQKAELPILIAGIGFASIPLAIAQRETLSNPFGFAQGSFKSTVLTFEDLRISDAQIASVVAAIVLTVVIGLWLKRSRTGLALRAIGADSETASTMGISKGSLGSFTMAVAGGMAGVAGVLFTTQMGSITPETGNHLILRAFAVVILGGLGSVIGVVVGSLALAITETLVISYTTGQWADVISFGLIFLVLVFRPQGIFGQKGVVRT